MPAEDQMRKSKTSVVSSSIRKAPFIDRRQFAAVLNDASGLRTYLHCPRDRPCKSYAIGQEIYPVTDRYMQSHSCRHRPSSCGHEYSHYEPTAPLRSSINGFSLVQGSDLSDEARRSHECSRACRSLQNDGKMLSLAATPGTAKANTLLIRLRMPLLRRRPGRMSSWLSEAITSVLVSVNTPANTPVGMHEHCRLHEHGADPRDVRPFGYRSLSSKMMGPTVMVLIQVR